VTTPNLYSYCIPVDDGAAPNPYWGYCTLAICKPAIRRVAQTGDWIIGTAAKRSKLGGGALVYAMRISDVLTLEGYDKWTKDNLPKKVPDVSSTDYRRRVGDSIYDFSKGVPRQRSGVHNAHNIATDLRGKNALISDHFYYFGNAAIKIPAYLSPIIHQRQGHKVRLNKAYVEQFLRWLKGLNLRPNHLYGGPSTHVGISVNPSSCGPRRKNAHNDLRCIQTC